MAFTAEQHKAYRQKLKEKGICVSCHTRPSGEYLTCQHCRDRLKERRDGYVEKGLCRVCGSKQYKNKLCERCYHKDLAQKRRMKINWKKAGLCYSCGGYLDDQSKVTCINCQEERQRRKEVSRSWIN